jgi:hypothetical protein
MDQARMLLCEHPGVETQGLKAARPVAEKRHVGPGDQPARRIETRRSIQVEGQNLLVAVEGMVARMVPPSFSARRLDFDDLGLEVAQEHGGHRPGHALAEVGDADTSVG